MTRKELESVLREMFIVCDKNQINGLDSQELKSFVKHVSSAVTGASIGEVSEQETDLMLSYFEKDFNEEGVVSWEEAYKKL